MASDSMSRRCCWAILCTLLALLWQAAPAPAHASLTGSDPAENAVLKDGPTRFRLTFSEPVSPLALKLVQPDGTGITLGSYALKDTTLDIAGAGRLEEGTYALSWRVISEDGHPVGGSVVFSVGLPSSNPPRVEDLVDRTVRAGMIVSKTVLYAGLFLGVGGVFFLRLFLAGARLSRWPLATALAAGAVGAVVSLGFQGLDALGAEPAYLPQRVVWTTAWATSYGRTVAAAGAALLLAAVALGSDRIAGRLSAVGGLLVAGLALALSGHASSAEPQWLTRPAVFLHAVSVAFWAGALMPLALALRGGEMQAVPALRRFSSSIPLVLLVLVAAGAVLASVQVEHPAALVDTAYGQVLSVKLGLVAVLFGLAAYNRRYLTRNALARDPRATRGLIRSIAAETLIVVMIFAVAACWRFTPPPRALALAAAMPETLHIHTEKAMADVTVTPGKAGPVTVSTVIMTGDFGPLDAREVTLVFSNPSAGIEPIRRAAFKPGDGTWRVDDLVLPVAGTWTLRIDILVSDFDMTRLQSEVHIRR